MNQVRLVVERELWIRLRSRAYIIGGVLLAFLGVAACWAISYFGPQLATAGTDASSGMGGNQQALDEVLGQYGIDPGEFLQRVGEATERINQASAGDGANPMLVGIGVAATVVLLMAIVTTGSSIAQGVVEEKSSRIVEILLATLKPWQLMAGKIIGIGIAGLVQIFAILGSTLAAAYAFGLTGFLSAQGVDLARIVLWSLAWFIVGYFSYACLYAAVGSTASKPEEIQNAVAPMTILIVLAYYASIFVVQAGEALGSEWGILVYVMKYVPLFSPLTMPGALSSGQASDIEGLISLGISVVCLPLIVMLASKIYSRSILQTGARVKLSAVFKTKS
jgi:ABC-2 type transport system permease protein